jgi:hypothetical protein
LNDGINDNFYFCLIEVICYVDEKHNNELIDILIGNNLLSCECIFGIEGGNNKKSKEV